MQLGGLQVLRNDDIMSPAYLIKTHLLPLRADQALQMQKTFSNEDWRAGIVAAAVRRDQIPRLFAQLMDAQKIAPVELQWLPVLACWLSAAAKSGDAAHLLGSPTEAVGGGTPNERAEEALQIQVTVCCAMANLPGGNAIATVRLVPCMKCAYPPGKTSWLGQVLPQSLITGPHAAYNIPPHVLLPLRAPQSLGKGARCKAAGCNGCHGMFWGGKHLKCAQTFNGMLQHDAMQYSYHACACR